MPKPETQHELTTEEIADRLKRLTKAKMTSDAAFAEEFDRIFPEQDERASGGAAVLFRR